MKNIRITLLVVLLAILITAGAGAQAAFANQQLAINRPSVGLQQAATPVITVNVTAQINAPAQPSQPAPSSGNNTGLILIVIVVILVLIILVGILISSRRPTDV